jgi:hypothetical protein
VSSPAHISSTRVHGVAAELAVVNWAHRTVVGGGGGGIGPAPSLSSPLDVVVVLALLPSPLDTLSKSGFIDRPRYGILGTQDTLEETKPELRCLRRIIFIRDNKIRTIRYTYPMCVDNQDGDNTIRVRGRFYSLSEVQCPGHPGHSKVLEEDA